MSLVNRARGDRTATPGRNGIDTVSVTCVIDERAHEVPDAELASGPGIDSGRYRALCGSLIAAAPMVMPDGRPCPECAAARYGEPPRQRRSSLRWSVR